MDPSDPLQYQSISAAALAATNSGFTTTVIEIEGMTSPAGPLGYSQTQTAESFPIPLPSGCTVKPHSSAGVFIWDSSGGASPANLFSIAQASGPVTVVQDLNFGGGKSAILVSSSTSGQLVDVFISGCRFSGNRYGVTALAKNGGVIGIEVKDCVITDATVPNANAALQAPMAGLRFHADDSQGIGPSFVKATVTDLVLSGTFTSMNPQSTKLYALQTVGVTYPTTRLIEVWSVGDGSSKQHSLAPASYAPEQITEVQLTVQGGDWVQNSVDDGGWDTAIHAEAYAGSNVTAPWDYVAGYRVSVSGATIDGFDEDGVYSATYHCARGNINLSGSTVIARTGQGQTFDEKRHSGVHLWSLESYSGLRAGNTTFLDNGGNGVYANTEGNFAAVEGSFDIVAPMGIFLGIQNCKIHQNDASGVFLRNFRAQQLSGFIGGTIHQDGGQLAFNIESDGEGFNVPHGQGVINRTAISNNGLAGVRVRSSGQDGLSAGPPRSLPSGVAIRLSNNFIWHNPMGGIDVEWLSPVSERKGLILMPVTHCTLVENGHSLPGVGWSMEINDNATSATDRATYGWIDPHPTTPVFMGTSIWNSIFVRDINTGFGVDFGPLLNQNLPPVFSLVDLGAGNTTLQDYQIGFAGVRGKGFWANNPNGGALMTNSANFQFLGPFDMFNLSPTQFHFGSNAGAPFVNWTPDYVRVEAPETAVDFGSQSRPAPSTGLRDKGADEL